MKVPRKTFDKNVEAVLRHTREYLENEIGTSHINGDIIIRSTDIIDLETDSVVAETGGADSLLIAFRFDSVFLELLYQAHTIGLDISLDERELYVRDTSAEVVNIILGHALADLALDGSGTSLSPPVVLKEVRRLRRPKGAMFATIELVTSGGVLDVHIVGPSDLSNKANSTLCLGRRSMHPLNVLIVDDSLLVVKQLTNMLQGMGHQVVKTAATGALALDAYRTCSPDLVTMDITMPDMDGIQATSGIIGQFPDANIIMVTSVGHEKMVMQAIKAGAKDYVLKPIHADNLQQAIARIFPQEDLVGDPPGITRHGR